LGQENPGFQGHNAHGSMQSAHQSSQQFAQFQSAPSYSQQYGAPSASLGQGGQSVDILAAGEALKDFKHLAIAAVRGATESSQPARNTLYQLAGEHLQMADQHYRWLEQRRSEERRVGKEDRSRWSAHMINTIVVCVH